MATRAKSKQAKSNGRKVRLTGEQLEILMGTQAISTLSNKELPAKTSYRIARIVDRLTREFKTYQDQRKKVLERHAKKDKNGKPMFTDEAGTAYDIDPAARADMTDDMDLLRAEMIELDIDRLDMSADELLEILEDRDVTITPMEASVLLTIAD
jgi:hypothetical protein